MENKRFKAVIFDLDGTLLDSLESISMGANEVLKQLGMKTHSLEEYKMFIGEGARELIRKALYAAGDTELKQFDKAVRLHQTAYEKYALYKLRPYEGIFEVIEKIKEKGVYVSVNTNKPEERAFDVLDKVFGKGAFDYIVGQVDNRPRKPAPDGCLLIAEKLNVEPSECIYIGDTKTDIMTGKSAGMFTIGAGWGFRTVEELKNNNADAIIQTPFEIIKFIK